MNMISSCEIRLLCLESSPDIYSPMSLCMKPRYLICCILASVQEKRRQNVALEREQSQETTNRASQVGPHLSRPNQIRKRDLSDISGRVHRPSAVAEATSQIFPNIKWSLGGTRRAHMDLSQTKPNHHLCLFKLRRAGVSIASLCV